MRQYLNSWVYVPLKITGPFLANHQVPLHNIFLCLIIGKMNFVGTDSGCARATSLQGDLPGLLFSLLCITVYPSSSLLPNQKGNNLIPVSILSVRSFYSNLLILPGGLILSILSLTIDNNTVVPWYPWEIGSRTPLGYQNPRILKSFI